MGGHHRSTLLFKDTMDVCTTMTNISNLRIFFCKIRNKNQERRMQKCQGENQLTLMESPWPRNLNNYNSRKNKARRIIFLFFAKAVRWIEQLIWRKYCQVKICPGALTSVSGRKSIINNIGSESKKKEYIWEKYWWAFEQHCRMLDA